MSLNSHNNVALVQTSNDVMRHKILPLKQAAALPDVINIKNDNEVFEQFIDKVSESSL